MDPMRHDSLDGHCYEGCSCLADGIAEEISVIGRCIGRANAQKEEDEASGYDVLALDSAEEAEILTRTLERLQRMVKGCKP